LLMIRSGHPRPAVRAARPRTQDADASDHKRRLNPPPLTLRVGIRLRKNFLPGS
jgi:hypothetical protein